MKHTSLFLYNTLSVEGVRVPSVKEDSQTQNNLVVHSRGTNTRVTTNCLFLVGPLWDGNYQWYVCHTTKPIVNDTLFGGGLNYRLSLNNIKECQEPQLNRIGPSEDGQNECQRTYTDVSISSTSTSRNPRTYPPELPGSTKEVSVQTTQPSVSERER